MHSGTVRAEQHSKGNRRPLGVLLGAIKALLALQTTTHFAQDFRGDLVRNGRAIGYFLGHYELRGDEIPSGLVINGDWKRSGLAVDWQWRGIGVLRGGWCDRM